MKLRNIIFGLFASVAVLVSCNPDEEQLPPELKVEQGKETIMLPVEGSEGIAFAIKATRDWTAVIEPENSGFTVEPLYGSGSGEPQTITVSATANPERYRQATLTITSGVMTVEVQLGQPGAKGDNYTIAELRAMETGTVLPENAKLSAVVTSDKSLGNLPNTNVYLQDETGGVLLYTDSSHTLEKGDNVLVDLSGSTINLYHGLLELEAGVDKITEESTEDPKVIDAKEISVEDLLLNKYESQYVSLSGVQVVDADLKKHFVEGNENTKIMIEDEEGNTFVVYSNKNAAALKEVLVPQGNGVLKGIASRYDSQIQLVLTSTEDYAGMTGERKASAFYVRLAKNTYRVGGQAGSLKVAVESNTQWTVDSEADWVTLSVSQEVTPAEADETLLGGNGSAELVIAYTAYDNTVEARSATITFTHSLGTVELTINQLETALKTIPEWIALPKDENEIKTYYKAEGYISEISNAAQGNFYIKDMEGKELYVYGCWASYSSISNDFETLGLECGDKVVVEGYKDIYRDTHELVKGVCVSLEKVAAKKLSVAEARSNVTDTKVYLEGKVMAKTTKSFILTDETGSMYVFADEAIASEIGASVRVSGDITKGDIRDMTMWSIEETAAAAEVTYPAPVEFSGAQADKYASNEGFSLDYVQAAGKVEKSGNYINIVLSDEDAGTTMKKLSPYYVPASFNLSSLVGVDVVVKGYVFGNSSSGSIAKLVLVDIVAQPYLKVSKTEVEVNASATNAKFSVNANLAWTVTTDADWIKSYTQSGENGGDVEITFDAYESTEADRTATFTISAEGQESITVTLVQKKYVAPTGATTTDELTAESTGVKGLTGKSYLDWTISDGFSVSYAGNSMPGQDYLQIRSSNSNSGIVSTTSGGKVRKVVIAWNAATTDKTRKLSVYGSNSAYTSAAELYDNEKRGTKLGDIALGETTLEIEGDYQYIGLRSNSGAIYLDKIEITWEN